MQQFSRSLFQCRCSSCLLWSAVLVDAKYTDPSNERGSHTSLDVCIPPPGWQLAQESDNSIMRCQPGTFKPDYGASDCTSCEAVVGKGWTTASSGATSAAECNKLQPGYALLRQGRVMLDGTAFSGSAAGLRTKMCPQMGQACIVIHSSSAHTHALGSRFF
jgi:hypothetical protein